MLAENNSISPTIDQSSTTQTDSILFSLNQNRGVFDDSFIENNITQIGIIKVAPFDPRTAKISPTQVGSIYENVSNQSFTQVSPTQIGIAQTILKKLGSLQTNIAQVGKVKQSFKDTAVCRFMRDSSSSGQTSCADA